MILNMKKALLAGTAIVAVGTLATINAANAAEVTTAGATDWGATAADFAGADADSLTFGGAHVATVDAAEDIGTTTTNSLSMSIDTRTSAGEVVFDGGAAGGGAAITVYGAVGDSSDFTGTGNAATLTIGDDTNDEGANVVFQGNIAEGTVLNFDPGTGTATVTLGDGSTATTVGANIDLSENSGGAAAGTSVLNLNGTTITGTISDTGTDNATTVNVDANSSIDGNVDIDDAANASVVVDDGVTLSIGATSFDILATGTVVLGDGTTDGATLVFDGTGAQAVTGLIDGDADNLSTVSITNTGGTVTFNQNIGVTNDLGNFTLAANADVNTAGELRSETVTIGSGATLDADGDILGNVVNSGTLDIASGAAAVTGDITGTGTLAASASAAIVGDVTQGAATIAASSELEIDAGTGAGTVAIGTVTAAAADSVFQLVSDVAETTTFTGNVVGAAADAGDVTFGDNAAEAQNYVFNGNIGTSTSARIDDIVVGGADGAAVATTISGNVYADDVSVGAADTLTLTGTTVDVDDLIGAGSLVIGDGSSATTVTSAQTDGGADFVNVTVAEDATLILQNDFTGDIFSVAGTIELEGTNTLDVDTSMAVNDGGSLVVNGDVALTGTNTITFGASAGDTMQLLVGSNADIDPAAAAAVDASGGTVTFAFTADTVTTVGLSSDQSVGLDDGDTVTWISGAQVASDFDGAIDDGRIVFQDGLIQYTSTSNNTDLAATVAFADAGTVFGDSSGVGVADLLMGLTDAEATTAGLNTLRDGLIGAGGAAAQESFAESLAPSVDGGFVVAGAQAADLSVGVTNDRIDVARNGAQDTGMVAGEMGENLTVWGKAFGQLGEQDDRDGIAGYEADTYGLAVGMDSGNVINDGILGLSFSYANTDVESDGVNETDTDVDSYQFSVYGSKDLTEDSYVSGIISYAMNNIDQTRYNVANTAGNNANADFDSDQWGVYAEYGRDYMVNTATVTPRVLANYQHVSFDGYTETGSTANQTVDTDDMDIFELGLGVTAAWEMMQDNGGVLKPSVTAEYRYDFVGDEVATTSSFTGGGASFQTEGFDPAQSTFMIGAGLEYELDNAMTVSADYGYQFKEDYDAHNLSLRAAMKF